jgi:hypothetical protein
MIHMYFEWTPVYVYSPVLNQRNFVTGTLPYKQYSAVRFSSFDLILHIFSDTLKKSMA